MNPSTIALITLGTLTCVSFAMTLAYHSGRNAQAQEDEETIQTMLQTIHNLTTRGI